MHMEDYDDRDGRKVWLTRDEVADVVTDADGTVQRIAIGLMARSGLRSAEVVDVTPADVDETPSGWVVRVQRGKGDKYRETPLTDSLAATINAYADVRDGGPDDPLVPRTTRTVRDWVTTIGERRLDDTGDDGWSHLSAHDLRRTWGTLLVDDEVEPGLVMEWGGWEDWETFREAYLGTYSTKAKTRAREKVDWL